MGEIQKPNSTGADVDGRGQSPFWARWAARIAQSSGEVTTVCAIRMIAASLVFAACATAGDRPSLAEQLVGRWESTSFVTTNCIMPTNSVGMPANTDGIHLGVEDKWYSSSLVAADGTRQTNLILCVYGVHLWTNSTAEPRQAGLDVGLFFTDHSGKERPIPEASGPAFLGERHIMFGGFYGYEFSYTLTNGFLTLEKFGCFSFDMTLYKVRVKAALKKVSSDPGDSLRVWHPEPDGTTNRSQPVRSETNRTSSAAGSRR